MLHADGLDEQPGRTARLTARTDGPTNGPDTHKYQIFWANVLTFHDLFTFVAEFCRHDLRTFSAIFFGDKILLRQIFHI